MFSVSRANGHLNNDSTLNDSVVSCMIDSLLLQASIDSLLHYAYSLIGTPYRYGAVGPDAFDCSGFTQHVFRKYGIELPHSSGGQSFYGIDVSRDKLQAGDLVFFKGRNSSRSSIGHVGIVCEVRTDDVYFIHASRYRGIVIYNMGSSYYKPRYIKARRIFYM